MNEPLGEMQGASRQVTRGNASRGRSSKLRGKELLNAEGGDPNNGCLQCRKASSYARYQTYPGSSRLATDLQSSSMYGTCRCCLTSADRGQSDHGQILIRVDSQWGTAAASPRQLEQSIARSARERFAKMLQARSQVSKFTSAFMAELFEVTRAEVQQGGVLNAQKDYLSKPLQ
ncbi:hypothetical protein MMC07_002593 [Pseudocyphellaria aurata]|nr:hypothetical protein [Pseudocyphellaria aurata]